MTRAAPTPRATMCLAASAIGSSGRARRSSRVMWSAITDIGAILKADGAAATPGYLATASSL